MVSYLTVFHYLFHKKLTRSYFKYGISLSIQHSALMNFKVTLSYLKAWICITVLGSNPIKDIKLIFLIKQTYYEMAAFWGLVLIGQLGHSHPTRLGWPCPVSFSPQKANIAYCFCLIWKIHQNSLITRNFYAYTLYRPYFKINEYISPD